MRLQLAEPISAAVIGATSFLTSPRGQSILKSAGQIFAGSSLRERNAYNGTLEQIKRDINLSGGITKTNAILAMENIPVFITQAQAKLSAAQAARDNDEVRVQARFIKAFEQILTETMQWYKSAFPAELPTSVPSTLTPIPAGATPTDPTKATPFFQKPAFLYAAAATLAAIFILPKLIKK